MSLPDLAALVLAAGAGTRLAPLTTLLPKPLCPVANLPLLEHALARSAPHVARSAINLHAHPEKMRAHLAGRDLHLSQESPVALGTAGAVGNLRHWIDGSPLLVLNADAYLHEPPGHDTIEDLVAGWSGETIRLSVIDTGAPSDFDTFRFAGASLTPWHLLARLEPVPSGLYELLWARAEREGFLELVPTPAAFIDCGTPHDYLEANLLASGGASVVAPTAEVLGEIHECVVWPGARVEAHESLHRVIRAGSPAQPLTVSAGPSHPNG